MLVGTHDGHFHCDDVMCFGILKLLFDDLTLVRTRDPDKLKECEILFDVGDKYDPSKKIFDHHFVGSPVRTNGVPYASAGLIWKHYGLELLSKELPRRTEEELEEIHRKIDRNIMQSIDAHDTYYSPAHHTGHYTLSQVVSSFLPSWKNFEIMDERFIQASELCSTILENNIKYLDSLYEAEKIILEKYMSSKESKILILEHFIPFESCILKYNLNVNAVIYQAKENEWLIQSVSHKTGRKLFPEKWAGKKDRELDEVSGIEGTVFCHPARFAAGHTTKEGAIKMAKKLEDF